MNTRIFAHRGASAYAPENTLEAFDLAVKMGADGVELDIHLCRTGEIVVAHDETVNRVSSGSGRIRELSLSELARILRNNWEGEKLLRARIRRSPHKYGNNDPEADTYSAAMAHFFANKVNNVPNEKGGVYKAIFHSARGFIRHGLATGALPDGRRAGEELSKNASASMGQNREGATAAILTTTKLDATGFTSDAALDLGLLPSAVQGEDGLEAMYGLVATFMKRNGHALHINVFNAETLRDAQANPDKYQDLQIRVCGWNVLWNNINKVEQDKFILQAENLM